MKMQKHPLKRAAALSQHSNGQSALQTLADQQPGVQNLIAFQRMADDFVSTPSADVHTTPPTKAPGAVVQRCKKKKKATGQRGLGYGSLLMTYTPEEIGATGLSISGHGSGASGSGQNAKTKKETAEMVEALKANREKAKAAKKSAPKPRGEAPMSDEDKIIRKINKLNSADATENGRLSDFSDYCDRRGYGEDIYDEYSKLIDM